MKYEEDEIIDDPPALLKSSQSKDLATKNLDGVFKCFRCTFSCRTTTELAAHYQIYRQKEPFKCFECGYNGRDRDDFVRHSISHIETNYFKCSKCEFKAKTSDAIRAHVQKGHTKDVFKCPSCGKELANKWNLRIHINRCKGVSANKETPPPPPPPKTPQHVKGQVEPQKQTRQVQNDLVVPKKEPVFFTCTFCFFIFSSQAKLTKHLHNTHYKKGKQGEEVSDKEVEEEVTTNSTSKRKVDRINKSTHLQQPKAVTNPQSAALNPKVNIEKIYLCEVCHFVFTSKPALNEHIITHKNVTDCPECGEQFLFNNDLKEHLTNHHSKEEKLLLCSLCDKSFASKSLLTLHKKEHLTKRTYKCPFCPRVISTESGLRLHMEAHSKVKTLYCSLCDFTTANQSILNKHHLKVHSKGTVYECKNCGAKYKYKHSLLRHSLRCLKSRKTNDEDMGGTPEIEIDISQKEKLICSECKTSFTEPAHLKSHLLIHFQNKPYRCMKCGLRCSTRGTFRNHMKTHSTKACACPVCGMKFNHRSALYKHKVTHSDEKPYQCKYCSLNFKRKANFKRHCDIHSDIKPFECPYCKFTTRRKDGLDKHIRTHEKGKVRTN